MAWELGTLVIYHIVKYTMKIFHKLNVLCNVRNTPSLNHEDLFFLLLLLLLLLLALRWGLWNLSSLTTRPAGNFLSLVLVSIEKMDSWRHVTGSRPLDSVRLDYLYP